MACSRSGVRTSPAPPFYAAVRQSRLTAVFLCSRRRGDGNAVHSSVAHSSAECVSAAQSWVGSTTGRRVNDGAGREVGTKVGVGRGVEGAAVVADGGGIAAHGSGGKHRPHSPSAAPSAAANAPALDQRSVGDFARARAITASTAGDRLATSIEGAGGGSRRWASRTACVLPSNGRRPTRARNTETPNAYTSAHRAAGLGDGYDFGWWQAPFALQPLGQRRARQ